jgi:hypothetical protein
MHSSLRGFAALLAVAALFAAAGAAHAQVYVAPAPVLRYYASPVTYAAPAPTVSYYASPVTYAAPAVSYYAAPAVSYYAAPPVTYAAPAVSYYAAPAVSYYAAPPVAYAAPVASYYAPASAVTTTYRYGILPRRQVTVTNYYSPGYYVP